LRFEANEGVTERGTRTRTTTAPKGAIRKELEGQRAALRKALVAVGAGDQVDMYMALARPAIKLTPRKAIPKDTAVGASRFFGIPDLPEGVCWPSRPGATFQFVAQIDLAAIAELDAGDKLPHDGLLSFFIAPDDESFPDPPTYVAHFAAGDALASCPGSERVEKTRGIDFALHLLLPPWASRLLAGVAVGKPYSKASLAREKGYRHGMLCFDRSFEEWQEPETEILLRLEDELPLPWDASVLYFHLTAADLAKKAFGRAAAHAAPTI
jgi:hypothetical protein